MHASDSPRNLSLLPVGPKTAFKWLNEYKSLNNGYKMVGNAVPVEFAKRLAIQVKKDIKQFKVKAKFNNKGRLLDLKKPQLELDL